MTKRADGELERELLGILWSSKVPMTPSEIRDEMADPIAYTSVATVLTRLQAKGLAGRIESGRGFAYSAVVSQAEFAANQMRDALSAAGNHKAVLAGFVSRLSKRDAAALRALLDQIGDR